MHLTEEKQSIALLTKGILNILLKKAIIERE